MVIRFYMTFWERVDEELKYRGMERKELGTKAGFPESYISKGISRKSCPQADLAVKIAEVLGVSVEYLVNGADTSKNKNAKSEENLHLFRKYQKLIQKCESLSPQKTELLATIADNFEKK